MRVLTLFITLFASFLSHAVAVSSLFEVANDRHFADFSIANNDGKDMFINLEIAKVNYENGKKVVTKVNKDNLASWTFSVNPSQIILKDGETRTIRMRNDCAMQSCRFSEDQVYVVDVNPYPYVKDSESSAVSVAFGYRIYFMDPASEVDLNYQLTRINKREFKFSNNSNTMLNAVLNTCKKGFSSDCIYQYKLLAGAEKTFKLPAEYAEKETITFRVINANESINEQVSI
ncbi:pilus assembly protein [Vibrio sp. SCSIO 43137]|uniref:pilus assembly protein n=1 Tax=Vibrio sp. SCSIO 43137 TaxID=3021011 RepID=UPI002307DCFD|nr:pilus assembly protein [Vibrio sp. SCSIO 43137]WCE32218.1 pilus assembly protein [Vibrio sp. SCSIO 43137]